MEQRRGNILKGFCDIGTMLPWWVTTPSALAMYAVLHASALSTPIAASGPPDALSTILPSIYVSVAAYAKYVIPGLLLAGALTSFLRQAKRSRVSLARKESRRHGGA